MSDLTGQTVAGYPIQKLTGKGSCVHVYQAASSGAPLTVRVLSPELRPDKSLNESVAKGWDETRSITHPSLTTIYSAGIDPAAGAFSLEEFVDGKSLRQTIMQGAKVGWRDAAVLAEQLFGALAALHAGGKVHGDIWPGNILITQDQDLKLEGAGALARVEKLVSDFIQGPPVAYFAPERLMGCPASPEADLYGAGMTLYFVLAGQDPLPGDPQAAIEKKPVPLSALREDVSRDVEEFIERLIAKDPTRRYGTAKDVLADLSLLKSGKPLSPLKGGRAVTPPAPKPKPSQAATRPSGHAAGSSAKAAAVRPSSAGSGGPMRKSTSGLGAAIKDAPHKVFGHLDTQVKSTIPRSDMEKKGDDYFHQGQLALALSSWKEAYEKFEAHAALKVKIELVERDLRRETFNLALEDARQRGHIGDFPGAQAKLAEAKPLIENDEQKQAYAATEKELQEGQIQHRKAGQIKLIVLAVVAVVVLIGLALFILGKK